jgi:hypothetical protein
MFKFVVPLFTSIKDYFLFILELFKVLQANSVFRDRIKVIQLESLLDAILELFLFYRFLSGLSR